MFDDSFDKCHLIFHLEYGAPSHVNPVQQEMHVVPLQRCLEGGDVRLPIDVDEEVSIWMQCLHQSFQLGCIGMG